MIHNEDCLATMERMEPCSIDMILTSPPYDDLRKYKGYSFDFEGVARSMYRVLKEGGVAAWVVGDNTRDGCESGTSHRQACGFLDMGWLLSDTMIYEKASLSNPSANTYYQMFEYILVLSKGKMATFNPIEDRPNVSAGDGGRGDLTTRMPDGSQRKTRDSKSRPVVKKMGRRFNIWRYHNAYMMGTKDKIAYAHPAMFPEKLAEDCIRSWSNPRELVYDPFMGSGTTAKAAANVGRRWVGSEISAEYCDIIRRRVRPGIQEALV